MTARVTEEKFQIPAADGFTIHGILNVAKDNPAKKAVLVLHGFGGHPNKYEYLTAKDFFTARGYDVIRPYFYITAKNARALRTSTLAQHAADLHTVLDHFKSRYSSLYATGHSYGGTTIIRANPHQVKAVSLWDAGFSPYHAFANIIKPVLIKELDAYYTPGAIENLMGREMLEEALAIGNPEMLAMLNKIKTPAQVIEAGNGGVNELPDLLMDGLSGPREKHVIAGAGHCFFEQDAFPRVLDAAHAWFEKF